MIARCVFCAASVDPDAGTTYVRVQGWSKRMSIRSSGNRRAMSDVVLRERVGHDVACASCVRMLKAGRSPRQMELGT